MLNYMDYNPFNEESCRNMRIKVGRLAPFVIGGLGVFLQSQLLGTTRYFLV